MMPLSMLDLPRELYLIICNQLSPTDLAQLAGVSRDYYLAAQRPLYASINILSFEKLVTLVRTLTKYPVVSRISPRQRQRWQSISDEDLRERDVRSLSLTLDTANGTAKVTGVILSRSISIISRTCSKVKISLALHGPWHKLLKELQAAALPDVRKLVMCLGSPLDSADDHYRNGTPVTSEVWDLCFSGSAFPDLQDVSIDTTFSSPHDDTRPRTLRGAALLYAEENHNHISSSAGLSLTPFYGLRNMTRIRLQYNYSLTTPILESLFGSSIIPQKLTTLEIVNCPAITQTEDLVALSMLLQRSLQLVKRLKLHLQCWAKDDHRYIKYGQDIDEHPDRHLCNIVRELGQQTESLDLALPFACSRVFKPLDKHARRPLPSLEYPSIDIEPHATFPERLAAAGLRHRRLIVWNGICREKHDWSEMFDLACEQGDNISWEIVGERASWHLSGCLPKIYNSTDLLNENVQL